MNIERFEFLLREIPRISEAIQQLPTPEIQLTAFNILVSSLENPNAPVESTMDTEPLEEKPKLKEPKKRKNQSGSLKFIKEIDLKPAGAKSFEEFIDEKGPGSNEDKYPVVIYYLGQILNLNPITIDYVYSVFRLFPTWKEPTNIKSGVNTAASRKGTIDSTDINDLKLTPKGRNFVERELPKITDK